MTFSPPSYDCPRCPRLHAFIQANRQAYPGFYNGPVPSFGALDAPFLIVGLAPGLKGANQTGRPFTGDYAGLVLYGALARYGFTDGEFRPEKVANGQGDGLALKGVRITNAVRCVPPQNKPEPVEIKECNGFLAAEMRQMPELRLVLSLGLVSHKAVLMALGLKQSALPFAHGAKYDIKLAGRPLTLLNSYHCSRYNINTGTLTEAMFGKVMEQARELTN